MTGLSLETDELVEVAALVTDGELNILGAGVDVVIRPSPAGLESMNDFVREMHTKSGLAAVWDAGLELAEAEEAVLSYVREYVPEVRKAPLAGNTIGTDRAFLAKYMPALEGHVHYRNVDVSSLKELARRWFPRVFFNSPAKNGGHRALADIAESIEELRYYREALFRDPPGLPTARLKQIAAQHQAAVSAALKPPADVAAGAAAADFPDSPPLG